MKNALLSLFLWAVHASKQTFYTDEVWFHLSGYIGDKTIGIRTVVSVTVLIQITLLKFAFTTRTLVCVWCVTGT
jgi:tetrahydromethanopterin S-methyltransferase subunit E